MEAAAERICDQARNLCPVDEGDLRASIGWTWGAAPSGSLTLGSFSGGGGLKLTIYAGNDKAFYARYVEFGTQAGARGQRVGDHGAGNRQSKKGRKSYRTHPGSSAQPFFFPAYRLEKKAAVARIRRAVAKAVREAGK
jgi:HK97 gp10 family phage protein